MTKRDLIEEVAQQYPRFSRRDAEVMVNTVFDSMTEALASGDRIEIRGFGSFIVKQRAAREGRNPRTGEIVSVAAKKVPLFKVGKELRLRVDGQGGAEDDFSDLDDNFDDDEDTEENDE
ncbi:MAG: integration host factor subunit beta [Candidatus Binatia bacterium]